MFRAYFVKVNRKASIRKTKYWFIFALVCIVICGMFCYNWNTDVARAASVSTSPMPTVSFVKPKDLCTFVSKLYQPLKDFEHFPCLKNLSRFHQSEASANCVRTVSLPEKLLTDTEGCVRLKFGRGTPICIYDVKEDIHVSRALYTRGLWEEEMIWPMLNISQRRPNMVLLDLGCNIGTYSLSAAQYLSRVYCVDPNYENLFKVSKSVTQGKLWRNITLIWNAISEKRATVVLRKELENVGGAAIDSVNKTVDGCDIAVDTIVLDDLAELFVGQEVYLKMDVQGVEHLILKSGKEFFRMADVRFVQMEVILHVGLPSGKAILETMFTYGYMAYTDCSGSQQLNYEMLITHMYDVCFIKRHA